MYKRGLKRLTFLLSTLLAPCFLYAEPFHSSASHEVELFYSYRNLNQNLETSQSVSDFILFGNSNWIAEMDSFRLEARPEVRIISRGSKGISPQNPNFLQLESPERSIETRFHVGEPGDQTILYGDWEKLNLSYTNESLEVSVGRKPFSLGVMKYLPVWNKFSRPLPGLTLIPIYFGSDGAMVKVKSGDWVVQASEHLYRFGRDQITTAQVIHYGEFANLHLMGGNWWNQTVFGLAVAKDILEGTLTSEYLNYGSQYQWGAGFERAMSDRITIGVETLYQSAGATSSLNYTPFLHSHFQIFQASFYSYEFLTYQWTSLLKTGLAGLTNWIDLGTAMNLSAQYSLSDHLELGIDTLIPAFRGNAEFSNRAFTFSDGTSFGIPLQAVLHLTWNF